MAEPRLIAVVRTMDDLREAFRARADELNITRESIDEVGGLQNGYAGKLLAPVPIKNIGRVSLGPLLTVMGVKLLLVVDDEALARYTARAEKRKTASATMLPRKNRSRTQYRNDSDWSKMQNALRTLRVNQEKRSKISKIAAKTRWRNRRKARARKRRQAATEA